MITLPTFEECNAIEREDRTPLEAFVWAQEPPYKAKRDEFRKLLGAVIEAERAQLKEARELLSHAWPELQPECDVTIPAIEAFLAKVLR